MNLFRGGDSLTLEADLHDFLLINFSVSPERVRPLLPPGYELETTLDESGTERAFVSTGLFLNRNFRPHIAPLPSLNFFQATYRTYVTFKKRRGVFFFATALETVPSFAMQGALARGSYLAEFNIINNNTLLEAQITPQGTHPGKAEFQVRKTLDETKNPSERQIQALTYRTHGFFKSRFGGELVQLVRHRRMTPKAIILESCYLEFWEKTGVLSKNEMKAPHSVLLEPKIRFQFFPPFPAHFLTEGASSVGYFEESVDGALAH